MPLIEVKGLQKEYRHYLRKSGPFGSLRSLFSRTCTVKKALNNVSFQIEEGELVGYVGPNGAGKSTTIKILAGILYPTAGQAIVNGLVPYQHRRENGKQIGVLFGQRSQLWWDIPLIDSLQLLKNIYRVPEKQYRQDLDMFCQMLDLKEFLDIPVRQLSLGQRMRGDIAASFLHNPQIIYLDEPTIGLDIISKNRIRKFIQSINKEKRATIILTTHDLSDIETLCQRVLIIDKGSLIYDGDISALKKVYGTTRVLMVQFKSEPANLFLPMAKVLKREGERVWFQFHREETSAAQLISQILSKFDVADLTLDETSLEAIISQIYEEGIEQ